MDRLETDKLRNNTGQLEQPESNMLNLSPTSSNRQPRRRSEPNIRQRGGDDGSRNLTTSRSVDDWALSPGIHESVTTTLTLLSPQEDMTSPRKTHRHTRHGMAGIHETTRTSRASSSLEEGQVEGGSNSPSTTKDEGSNDNTPSGSSRSFRDEKQAAQGASTSERRHKEPAVQLQSNKVKPTNHKKGSTKHNNKKETRHKRTKPASSIKSTQSNRKNLQANVAKPTNPKKGSTKHSNKKETRRKKIEPFSSIKSTQSKRKNFPGERLISGISVVVMFIVLGIVAYFVINNWWQASALKEPTAASPSTLTFAPQPSPPLYGPPQQEDCIRVRRGDQVREQDLLFERSFDVVLHVTMGIQLGPTEAMNLLEEEIQRKLMPKLVGCSEAPKRRLRLQRNLINNPFRYIVGNGKVTWMPESTQENSECLKADRRCLGVTFNMDLFLKTTEVQYFDVVNLIEDIFGDDLVDTLQLQSPPFVSVAVQFVVNLSPTVSPTEAPTAHPTSVPTPHPTQGPSSSPTMMPSSRPTRQKDNNGYLEQLDRPIRVSCAGDSLTRGTSGGNPSAYSYPAQLRGMLGENFEVHNFGRNAVTAMRGMAIPYVDLWQFQASLDVKPDIYLLMLGTNDARYWDSDAHRFPEGMSFIVKKVQSVSPESPPRIMLAIPPWVKTDVYGIREEILSNNVRVEIERIAREFNLQLVNMHDVTVNQADMYTSDGLHLNQKGYHAVAEAWKQAIECNNNGICEVGENCETCPGDCYVNCPAYLQ